MTAPTTGRRAFLVGAGAVALAGCAGGDDEGSPLTTASGPSDATTSAAEATVTPTTRSSFAEPLTPASFSPLAICTLTRSDALGPFPSLEQLDRRDVTEGYPGEPLRLGIRVVDRECRAIPDARVEIWHTDASGDYSSYEDGGSGKDEGSGTTFMRGVQTANADGILEFQTIYPGWYGGRAVHIHARVRVGESVSLTTQLYFDEAYTDAILETGEYARFGPPDTGWADDPLIGDPTIDGTGLTLSPAETMLGAGTLGLVNLGVSV